MSRLDFCKYELVDDCYDWKNDNCDECNIFKAYCEGARRAKNSIVRCKDCKYKRLYDEGETKYYYCALEDRPNRNWSVDDTDYCSWGERREKNDYIPQD